MLFIKKSFSIFRARTEYLHARRPEARSGGCACGRGMRARGRAARGREDPGRQGCVRLARMLTEIRTSGDCRDVPLREAGAHSGYCNLARLPEVPVSCQLLFN